MTIKFSDYLTKIYRQNDEISHFNSWEMRQHRPQNVKLLLHVPSKTELELKFSSKFETLHLLAKIGYSGAKVHNVIAEALRTPNGYIIWTAASDCGSQKWSPSGRSPIFPFEDNDLTKVNCDKCLGIRTPGGKKPEAPKRIPIDPDTRPKEYSFDYKVDYPPKPGNSEPITRKQHETKRAMTPEEAINKIIKEEKSTGFTLRAYDFDLQAIYAWNGKPLYGRNPNKDLKC